MANANAVKIRSTKKKANGKPKYPKPSGANLAHNSAVNKATYWLNDGNKIIQSQSYNNTHEVNADWIKWENEARERYLQNEKNQRAIKSNAVLLEEGLIIIGTDVNAKEKDIEKIVKDFVAKFEKDNNTKVRHWAYHNHEGHEEDGKEHINRHVHFIFDNVDNNGTMVRRNWKRDYFRQMQTDIFDISKKYIKNIERAKESEYEEVEIEDRIVKVNTKKQIHHRVFRQMKENEQIEDLSQEKTTLKKEITSLKSQNTKSKNEKHKLKEELEALKEETKQLRADLQVEKAEKEAYQQLDYLNKQLQEQLKTGRKSFEEAKREVEDLREKLIKKEEDFKEIEDLKKENEHLKSVIEVKEIDILELKNAQTTLNKELQEVNSQCEFLNFNKKELEENFKTTLAQKDKFLENLQEIGKEIAKEVPIKEIKEIPEAVKTVLNQNKSLQEQKTVLNDKLVELEKKINSSSNMSHPQPPISIQKEFELIKKEELEEKEIKTGLFGTEKIKVLKPDGNILQRTWNIVASKYEDLKTKYNDLVNKFNALTKENLELKAKVQELTERSSTKQQNQTHTKDHLEAIVEKFEVNQGEKSDSSLILNKSKELTLREKFEAHREVTREQIKEDLKEKKEEKSKSKSRGYGKER
ncbi:hypothetical protein [Aliarcobacter butzleri]|uniref:hypothetical protein n=1 Tax=Aliarcobacter butzleri TaxID=28197 RepID=UPI0027394EFE|nr:hypothetical protein [Aliarcobacter butzleri]